MQGPPGTGKTTRGAELVRALLDAGLTVGVTANSHAVIGKFLAKVGPPGVQKCDAEQHCGSDRIVDARATTRRWSTRSTGGARLVGGTAWLWSRPATGGRAST